VPRYRGRRGVLVAGCAGAKAGAVVGCAARDCAALCSITRSRATFFWCAS
jgi:hypothetical protein